MLGHDGTVQHAVTAVAHAILMVLWLLSFLFRFSSTSPSRETNYCLNRSDRLAIALYIAAVFMWLMFVYWQAMSVRLGGRRALP